MVSHAHLKNIIFTTREAIKEIFRLHKVTGATGICHENAAVKLSWVGKRGVNLAQ